MREALNHVDGAWVPAAGGAFGERHDPATGELGGRHAASGADDAARAIAAARAAFESPAWASAPRLRQMALLRWADRMEADAPALAELLTRENGKVLAQSRAEIAGAVSEIRYYAGLARHLAGHVLEVEPGVFSTMIKEPAGVAGVIVPWNAPVVLLVRSLAPALAAGCTAVVKPAPQTALVTAAVLGHLTDVPELPRGVVNLVVESGHEVALALVASREVDVVSFTGSNATGSRIMAAAAPTMKRLSLELGGKSACLVFEDADVDTVAPALAAAATIISGQQCTAARRVLVHASRYAAMKGALAAALAALKVAPGLAPGAQVGPLVDAAAAASVGRRIEEAMDAADEVVLRARRGAGAGGAAFVTPALVAHGDTGAFFVQEEIFGPLVVIERFEDEKEALARANHSEFGLSASVWTRDGARALRVARALRDGTVWINDHNRLFAEAETGGYRRSGIGRLHGVEGLADFQETKHIYQQVGTA